MSCNLCSDLGGTNIRNHGWTKSSLRPTATAYRKHWEPSKKAEIGWFWSKATPNFSWEARFDMTCSHQKTVLVRDFRRGQKFNNRIQKSWWRVFRSLVLEASSFETASHKVSPKNAKNSLSKQEDLFVASKQKKSSRSVKPTNHNIISNWNSARQQILGKETEMSCNLCSDFGGTNIRNHGWTKSKLRPTATAYQKHWEPSKKAEIGWFWRKATPKVSWEARFDVTYCHQKTVLVRYFRRGERFNK